CGSSRSRRIHRTRSTRRRRPGASRSSSPSRNVDGAPLTRRVIFLDIDGVLAPIRRWDRYGDLDAACINVLNEIVAASAAEIVVSSTWRHTRSVAELQEILDAAGFKGRVIDKTRNDLRTNDRSDEIAAWLTEHEVARFVIIDDHVVDLALRPHLVLTEPARGLV